MVANYERVYEAALTIDLRTPNRKVVVTGGGGLVA
jgi:hypothetical protein